MTDNIVFDGGSEADRRRVLELQQAYLDANATFDWIALDRIWSHDPTSVFFNTDRAIESIERLGRVLPRLP